MTYSTRREDKLHAERPHATTEEFAEYLKYADDLAVMRFRHDEAAQLTALAMVGGVLWAFGIGFRLIEFEFGMFYAICLGVTFISVYWWKLRCRCPRCGKKFGNHMRIAAGPFRVSVRFSPPSEACKSCGLRSLSQYDVTLLMHERSSSVNSDETRSG